MSSNRTPYSDWDSSPDTNDSVPLSSFIFKPLDPFKAYELLAQMDASWLLRESKQAGMITVDMVQKDNEGNIIKNNEGKAVGKSYRFAFVPGKGWESVGTAALELFKQNGNYEKIYLAANDSSKVQQLLTILSVKLGLETSRDMLQPLPEQASTVYTAYTNKYIDPKLLNPFYISNSNSN